MSEAKYTDLKNNAGQRSGIVITLCQCHPPDSAIASPPQLRGKNLTRPKGGGKNTALSITHRPKVEPQNTATKDKSP